MKPRYFFSGDHHFWHKNIILPEYENRPYMNDDSEPDVEAMNSDYIARWQEVVSDDDIVCYVGDLSFGGYKKTRQLLKELPGKLVYIQGNHDNKAVLKALDESGKLLFPVAYMHVMELEGQHIILSHCAFQVWFGSHHGSWNLYGHSHGNLKEVGKKMDVGVDAMCKRGLPPAPVPFEFIRGILDSRSIVHFDHHDTRR